jgi:hypothetical protein
MACPTLTPHRALLHPLWALSLVVLATNDHWLKYSDLLPDPVTGKLSDFAGMLVAPVLFAALVGVRTRKGLVAAHVAVGVVFTMIQLSRSFADAWSALMGTIGVPWIITCDPTDLVALPALWLGMRVYPRAMQRTAVASLRKTGEVAGAGIGLLFCVATSRPEPGEPFVPDLEADVYVHNDTEDELVVRVRPLAVDAEIDCDVVASDPGRLLSAALFDTVQSWTLAADANLAVFAGGDGRLCHAALVDADGWPTRLAFWRDGNPPRTLVAGEGIDDAAPGWIRMFEADGEGEFEAGMEILFELDDDEGPEGGVCRVQDDGERNAWGDEVPYGAWTLTAVEDGLDGCIGLGLADIGSDVERTRWYVCTPGLDAPFAVGDAVEIGLLAEWMLEGVSIRAVDVETLAPAEPARELLVSRGNVPATIADVDSTFVPVFDCDFTVDGCGTVARSGVLVVGGPGWPSAEVEVGGTAVLEHTDGAVVRIALAHGQDRRVVVDECALGPIGLGHDVEIAATYVGAAL